MFFTDAKFKALAKVIGEVIAAQDIKLDAHSKALTSIADGVTKLLQVQDEQAKVADARHGAVIDMLGQLDEKYDDLYNRGAKAESLLESINQGQDQLHDQGEKLLEYVEATTRTVTDSFNVQSQVVDVINSMSLDSAAVASTVGNMNFAMESMAQEFAARTELKRVNAIILDYSNEVNRQAALIAQLQTQLAREQELNVNLTLDLSAERAVKLPPATAPEPVPATAMDKLANTLTDMQRQIQEHRAPQLDMRSLALELAAYWAPEAQKARHHPNLQEQVNLVTQRSHADNAMQLFGDMDDFANVAQEVAATPAPPHPDRVAAASPAHAREYIPSPDMIQEPDPVLEDNKFFEPPELSDTVAIRLAQTGPVLLPSQALMAYAQFPE